MAVKIGKPKTGKGNREIFKLKDGDSVFMILPPLGELADEGKWNAYLATHFGYKDSTGRMKPFLSTKVVNRKTKMVEVPDLACDRIDQIEALYKQALEVRDVEKAKMYKSLKERYNLDKKFYMNAMTLDGKLGILKIPYKSMEVLRLEIDRQKAAGVDIMDVENGRFIVFRRSGNALDTAHQVFTYKESMEIAGVGKVEKEKVAKLDEATLNRLEDEVSLNLTKMFKVLTPEEIEAVVKADIAGDVKTLDAILNSNSASSAVAETAEEVEEADDIPENKLTAAPVVEKAAQSTPVTQTQTSQNATTTTTVSNTAVAAGKNVNAMSDEEFMKMINQ
jgi:hypothetical protein